MPPFPTRLLEMLPDRFGAVEAIANSSIKLARVAPDEELVMDVQAAEAVLEFGDSWTSGTIWTALRNAMSMAGDVLVAEAVPEFPDDLR